MKTLTLEVQDNFVPNLLEYLKQFKNEVHIQQDKNLELDPYFYERQEKLHQIRNDVKNGNMRLLSQEESDNEIELFFKELEK
jgi:anthranilate/para-aminobenzoate synthase component II